MAHVPRPSGSSTQPKPLVILDIIHSLKIRVSNIKVKFGDRADLNQFRARLPLQPRASADPNNTIVHTPTWAFETFSKFRFPRTFVDY